MITISVWTLLLCSLVAGYAMARIAFYGVGWMVREGPYAESTCPICLRPHHSEARQLQRWLDKAHEENARLMKENETLRRDLEGSP